LKVLDEVDIYIKTNGRYILTAASITLLILIVYKRDLEIIANEALRNEALSHILLIPFLAGVLLYLRKDLFNASLAIRGNRNFEKTTNVDAIIGASLCLVAFLTYWYGSYTFHPLEYHLLSLPIFLMGVTMILFNLKAVIALIYPISFLFFLVPPPTELTYALGGALANFNTQASHIILKTLGLPVILSSSYGPPTLTLTTSLGTPASFTIDLPCSGIYSLIGFAVFAVFLAFIASAPLMRKTGVLLLGFVVLDLLNITRITAVISAAYLFGEQLAMTLFHTLAGFVLIFVGIIITLFVAEKIFNIQILPTRKELLECPECKEGSIHGGFCLNCGNLQNSSRAQISKFFLAKILLLVLGCSIATTSISAPTFAIAKGPIDVTSNPTWENATNIFPQIQGYNLAFLYRDTDFERTAHQDASLVYAYFPTTRNKTQSTIFGTIGVADSISNLHSWEVCLISMQIARGQYPLVTVLDQRDIQLLTEVPLIARYLVFESPQKYTQVTLYWYEKATFRTGISVAQKYVRISLIILTQIDTPYKRYEEELIEVGRQTASHWEPLKTQSLISLGIPAQQILLASSITFVAFTTIAHNTYEKMKRTNNQKIFQNFASQREKLILQTIQELAQEKKKMETRDIKTAIEKKLGESLELEELIKILNKLEKYGFVRKDIASVENRPKLIWKILFSKS
jgi:exosortase